MSEMSWLTDDDNWNAEDAADDAGDGEFSAIPDGEYEAEVISAEEREIDSANGTGVAVNVQFAIRGDKYANRRVFERYNVLYKTKHDSKEAREKAATAQRIGRGQFGALCVALGISKRPGSYDELVGKFCRIKVGHEVYRGEKKNRVKGVKESKEFATASRPEGSSSGGGGSASPWG